MFDQISAEKLPKMKTLAFGKSSFSFFVFLAATSSKISKSLAGIDDLTDSSSSWSDSSDDDLTESSTESMGSGVRLSGAFSAWIFLAMENYFRLKF